MEPQTLDSGLRVLEEMPWSAAGNSRRVGEEEEEKLDFGCSVEAVVVELLEREWAMVRVEEEPQTLDSGLGVLEEMPWSAVGNSAWE